MRTFAGILLVAIAAIAVYWWPLPAATPPGSPAPCRGLPRADDPGFDRFGLRILTNSGFTVGYSELYANPLWVAYSLSEPRFPPPRSRPDRFSADPRSFRAVDGDAFRGSGYQRGHLAPNYAMYRVHGTEAQQDSFLMTNISPQRPNLNQKLWQRLEEAIMDHLLPGQGDLCVITGPIFEGLPYILPSGVAIPDGFYKIVVSAGAEPRVLAFAMPQSVNGDEPLDRYLVPVDEIERRTGLDFLSALDDRKEQALEAVVKTDGWGLQKVARLPARF